MTPRPLVRHGAMTVMFDPVRVRWHGRQVSLSRTEAHLFAQIALRGRASFEEIDAAIEAVGAGRRQRRKLLHYIRQKFKALGAADPFAPLHQIGLRIADAYTVPDDDEAACA